MKCIKMFLAVGIITMVFTMAFPLDVLASCTYSTYYVNGRMVSCTTCCYGNICNTNCY